MCKNVRVNNINTLAFLTEEEKSLYNELCENFNILGNIKRYCYQVMLNEKFTLTFVEHAEKLQNNKYYKKDCTNLLKKKLNEEQKKQLKQLKENKYVDQDKNEYIFKNILKKCDEIKKEVNRLIRSRKLSDICKLNVELNDYRKVYASSSVLTRNIDAQDIFIVSLHNKHIKTIRIWEQIIKNGFTYTDINGSEKKVVFYTSSAGQIRKKKGFFVVEDSLNAVIDRLNCGLTLEKINELGGCNVNKYLAYAALNTSNTEIWKRFDIDKTIVVNDFETEIEVEVDYIDNKTFKITRKKMNVPIPHSDGCGIMLSNVSRKNMMVRLPWVKGLLTVANFQKFNTKYGNNTKIKDIYGKEHNINDIEVIFSKSQFKMWKYYNNEYKEDGTIKEYGWDRYKRLFKEYGCTANVTNIESNKSDFKQATLNYQMIQTLTDVKNDEIKSLLGKDLDYINNLYTDSNLQFKELTKRKDAVSQILKEYPNFIHDAHIQNELSSRITKIRKDLKKGEFHVDNAKYTFLIPDIVAWMQFLFCEDSNPTGALKNGQVHCSMFKYNKKVDVLRSPHLWKEHAIRINVEIDEEYREFFKLGNSRQLGIYTSTHDGISKLLMYDNDGDSALVVQDERFNAIVKRNTEGVVPLFYKMSKAPAQQLSNVAFYKGLKSAFKYNQVGRYSNYMTAEWNTTQDIDTLRVLTSLNNYSIDAAKCLYMCYPEKDSEIYKKIEEAKAKNMPHFFRYQKDGYENKELTKENTTMNKLVWYLEKEFENANGKRYAENKIEKFNYKEFLNNKSILGKKNLTEEKKEIYEQLYKDYKEFANKLERVMYQVEQDEDKSLIRSVYDYYTEKLKIHAKDNNIEWIEFVDVIIALNYKKNKESKNKTILLELFQKEILSNLAKNLK